jgi:hypothetical protein
MDQAQNGIQPLFIRRRKGGLDADEVLDEHKCLHVALVNQCQQSIQAKPESSVP